MSMTTATISPNPRRADLAPRAAHLGSSGTRSEGAKRLLLVVGAVLIVSGLVHLGVFLVDGGAWAGPVSWRKPAVFGLSLGLFCITLGWILDAFPSSSLRPVTAWPLAVSVGAGSLIETFLISLQRWRGVASHFNEATSFDAAVFAAMGVAISLVAVPTVVLAARSARRLQTLPSRSLAIRVGLALLVLGQVVVGGFMIAAGAQGAGAFKAPHALVLHGLQVLLVADWLLGRTGLSQRLRTRGVAAVAITWVVLVAVTLAWAWVWA